MIESMDDSVGRVTAALERLGLERNTFIVFMSDNGGYLDYPAGGFENVSSNGPLKGQKTKVEEGVHHMPCIFYWPEKIAAAQVTDETVLTMDLFPTFARLAGAELPRRQQLDVVDLTSLLLEQEPLMQRTIFWRIYKTCAVRRGPWKLNHSDRQRPQLYNRENDLSEATNVAAAHQDIVAALMSAYDVWETNANNGFSK